MKMNLDVKLPCDFIFFNINNTMYFITPRELLGFGWDNFWADPLGYKIRDNTDVYKFIAAWATGDELSLIDWNNGVFRPIQKDDYLTDSQREDLATMYNELTKRTGGVADEKNSIS